MTAAPLRYRLDVALGLIVVSAVVGGLCYRSHSAHRRAVAAAAVHQEEIAAEEPFQKTITIKVDRHATMREWLAEFTRQTGIAAEAKPIDHYRVEGGQQSPIRIFDDTFPVNVELPPSRAVDLLDTIAHVHDIHWKQRSDGSIEFNWNHDKESIVARQYALPIDLTRDERAGLQGLLWKYAQYRHYGARVNTTEVRLGFTPAGCTIVHSPSVHLGVPRFLEQCLAAMQSATDASGQNALANLEHCPHTWLHIEEAIIRDLEAVLDRPITLSAEDMSWPDFAAELSRQASFPLALTPDFAEKIATLQPTLSCQFKNVPLRQVAQNIRLPAFNPIFAAKLNLFPTGNGRALLMGEYRADAQSDRHHHLCAYPVGDLTIDSEGVSHAEDLASVVVASSDHEWGTFHLGNYKMDFFLNGQLMVVSQRLEVHRKIQELLTALRRVRSSEARNIALENERPPKPASNGESTSAKLRAVLSRPLALQYSGVRLADIMHDLRERTNLRLVVSDEESREWTKAPPVWCYLPKRPFGENLHILLAACGFELIEQGDQCWVVTPQPELDVEQGSEVFDLRPWLHRSQATGVRLVETIPLMLGQRRSSARMVEFRELLVANGEPSELASVSEIVGLLAEHFSSAEPRHWRGEALTGERLNQPLAIRKPAAARPPPEPELNARLQEPVSVSFKKVNVADALLTLASRHDLPIVVQELPSDGYGLEHIISYQAVDKPLRNILHELVGNPTAAQWQVQSGSIRIIEEKDISLRLDDIWYSVHDLLAPLGPYQPDELLDELRPAVLGGVGPATEPRDPFLQLHLGHLLRVRSGHVSRGALEKLLRELRNQEPQP